MNELKKMSFLLIMPRLVATIGEGYHFPLGVAYISAVMKQSGFHVITLNLNHTDGEIEDIIIREIIKNKIDVVMAGGLSGQYSSLKGITDCVHYQFPEIRIVIGGGIVTAEPIAAMTALEYAHIGVIGEGETTVVELCNALQEDGDLSEIDGIIYNSGERWLQTKAREEIMDLDSLPFPDYDGFALSQYLELSPAVSNGIKGGRSFSLISSRSCPFQCTFCFHTVGKKYRQRSVDNVIKEMKILIERYNVAHIKMSDELFARDKERVKEIERFSRENGITWNASFRVDDIDDELIQILKNGNCTSMVFGLESADDRVLKSMRKHITVEQIESTLQKVYDAGLPINGNFIFGDSEETIETANKTLDWFERHKHYGILLDFIIIFPGTQLYKDAVRKGIIIDPVQFLKDGCPHINVSKMNDDEFSTIAKKVLRLSAEARWEIEKMDNIYVSDTGRISFDGECVKCGIKQRFSDVPMFFIKDWTFCMHCGQKHEVRIPDELVNVFIENLHNYLVRNKRIALWGITPSALILFENNELFKDDRLTFIDNSLIKQKIRIHGKKVYDPDEALKKEIDTAIYFHTPTFNVAVEKVKKNYPNIKHFDNACDLLRKKKVSN